MGRLESSSNTVELVQLPGRTSSSTPCGGIEEAIPGPGREIFLDVIIVIQQLLPSIDVHSLDQTSRVVQKRIMSNVVSIHPYFKVHAGQLAAFKALLPKFVERTQMEEKCHWYDFSVCEDLVHCREAYDGAEGLLTHLGNVDALIGEALSISDLARVEVHGPVEELAKLKEPLADLKPDYFEHQLGIGKP